VRLDRMPRADTVAQPANDGTWEGSIVYSETGSGNTVGSGLSEGITDSYNYSTQWSARVSGVVPAFETGAPLALSSTTGNYTTTDHEVDNYNCNEDQSDSGSSPFDEEPGIAAIAVDDYDSSPPSSQNASLTMPWIGISGTDTFTISGAPPCEASTMTQASGARTNWNDGVAEHPSTTLTADPTVLSGQMSDIDNFEGTTAQYTITWHLQLIGAPDSDRDGLSDYLELVKYGTDPQLCDTDGDGWSDGAEVAAGTNPRVASSHPSGTPSAKQGCAATADFRVSQGSGTVTFEPGGHSCPSTCEVRYPVGTSVSVTATPDHDHHQLTFRTVSLGGAECVGVGSSCSISALPAGVTLVQPIESEKWHLFSNQQKVDIASAGADDARGAALSCSVAAAETALPALFSSGATLTLDQFVEFLGVMDVNTYLLWIGQAAAEKILGPNISSGVEIGLTTAKLLLHKYAAVVADAYQDCAEGVVSTLGRGVEILIDPHAPNDMQVALPQTVAAPDPCHGSVCAKPRGIMAPFQAAQARVAGIQLSQAITANRFVTAVKARSRSGMTVQRGTSLLLAGEYAEALVERHTVAKATARDLTQHHLDITLTRAQVRAARQYATSSGAVPTRMIAGLIATHVVNNTQQFRDATLASLAASPAQATSLTATLRRGVDTAGLKRSTASITPAEAQAVVTALVHQRSLTGHQANRIIQALHGPRSSRRGQLDKAVRALSSAGGARALLAELSASVA
jgi:hypothetical protein